MNRSFIGFLQVVFVLFTLGGLSAADLYAGNFGNTQGGGKEEEQEEQPDEDCDGGEEAGSSGQPVLAFNGRETVRETDIVIPGLFDIRFQRRYESNSTYDSVIGYGWSHNFDRRLYEYPNGSVVIRYGCGYRNKYFKDPGSGNYRTASKGRRGILTETNGIYTFEKRNGIREVYDEQGRLTDIISRTGQRLSFEYDSRGKLPLKGTSPKAVDPTLPMTVAYHYRLTTVKEYAFDGAFTGNSLSLFYNEDNGRLIRIEGDDGRVVHFSHDESDSAAYGNLTKVIGLENYVQTYRYEDTNHPHKLTYFQKGENTEPYINDYHADSGEVTKQTYGDDVIIFQSANNGMDKTIIRDVKDEQGNVLYTTERSFLFDDDYGKTEEIVDQKGHKIKQRFDSNFHLRSKTYLEKKVPLGELQLGLQALPLPPDDSYPGDTVDSDYEVLLYESYDYDDMGNQTQIETTLEGHNKRYVKREYEAGWLVWEEIVDTRKPDEIFYTEYTFHRDSNNRPVNIHEIKRRKADSSFITTTFHYDAKNRLERVEYPDGTARVSVYEPNELFVKERYWEIDGQPIDYDREYFTYNKYGLLAYYRLNGNKTSFFYDKRLRLTRIYSAANEMTYFNYENKNLTSVQHGYSWDGAHIMHFDYDERNRLQAVRRETSYGSELTLATFGYDSVGNRLRQTDGEGHSTRYSYDYRNRLETITYPGDLSPAETYAYDSLDRLIRSKDSQNRATEYNYDPLSRLLTITQLGITPSAITKFTYDAVGNLLTVTDPEQNTTEYQYDRLSRRTHEIRPLGQSTVYTYDDRNRLNTLTRPSGLFQDYQYYDWGPLEKLDFYQQQGNAIPQRSINYQYNHAGNLLSVIDSNLGPDPVYEYTYDASERVETIAHKYLPGLKKILHYRYNNLGQWVGLDLQVGDTIYPNSLSYDDQGRLKRLTWAADKGLELQYYQDDLLQQLGFLNGVVDSRTYYPDGPLESVSLNTQTGTQTLDYLYDLENNVDNLTVNGALYDYAYDGINRLTQAIYPQSPNLPAQEDFAYDLVGNRENPQDENTYDYDANNRLLTSPGSAYSYSDDGHLESSTGGAEFTHNEESRLIGYQKGTTVASYKHDPFGRRIQKTVDGATTWFLWDGSQLLAEFNSNGDITRRYGYLGLNPVAYFEEQAGDVLVEHTLSGGQIGNPGDPNTLMHSVDFFALNNGDGVALWVEEDIAANSSDIYLRYYDADTGWTSGELAIQENLDDVFNPSIKANSQGDLLISFLDPYFEAMYAYYKPHDGDWTSRITVVSAATNEWIVNHHAVLDEHGKATFAWKRREDAWNGLTHGEIRRYTPAQGLSDVFKAIDSVPKSIGYWGFDRVLLGANNDVWFLLPFKPDNNQDVIYAIRYNNSGDNYVTELTKQVNNLYSYDFDTDALGNALLIYSIGSYNNVTQVNTEYYTPSVGWVTHNIPLWAEWPGFALSVRLNNGLGLLTDYISEKGTYVGHFDGQTWTAPLRISDKQVTTSLASDGRVLATEEVWTGEYTQACGASGCRMVKYFDLYTFEYDPNVGWSNKSLVAESIDHSYFALESGESDTHHLVWWGYSSPLAGTTVTDSVEFSRSEFYGVHTDHLGTPRWLTDRDQEVVWSAEYEAFGTAYVDADPDQDGKDVEFNLRFPGQYFDGESGLHYNYYRDYDPSIGRYIQSDPIGLAGGLNTYVYVSNNPLYYIDPLGLNQMNRSPYAPGSSSPSYVGGFVGGAFDFGKNYMDMREAWWKGADKYFHCKANCEAAQRGEGGQDVAECISDTREWYDQNVKGDPASASAADQAANLHGRSQGTLSPKGDCRQMCSQFRPNGLPNKY